MPVQRIVKDGQVKWRWGTSGKEYATKQQAEAQGRAAYAAGYGKDKPKQTGR